MLGGRARSPSTDAWMLLVQFAICNRAVSDAGIHFVCSPLSLPRGDLPRLLPRPPPSNVLLNAGVKIALTLVYLRPCYIRWPLPSHLTSSLLHSARFHYFSSPAVKKRVKGPWWGLSSLQS